MSFLPHWADCRAFRTACRSLQDEKSKSDISVGVYNIVADFGQSRGANTATILPNDADHTRKYGRTILLRYNIMANPAYSKTEKRHFRQRSKRNTPMT